MKHPPVSHRRNKLFGVVENKPQYENENMKDYPIGFEHHFFIGKTSMSRNNYAHVKERTLMMLFFCVVGKRCV